jgi:cytochrome P450
MAWELTWHSQEMEQQIREIPTGRSVDVKEVSHKTVFIKILDSKNPAAHATEIRLQNEAMLVIGAGFETTRWALIVASYHILANPHVLDRLRVELEEAIPDS